MELPGELVLGEEYWVFFDVRPTGDADAVLLFVQSAYVAIAGSKEPRGRSKKKVGFNVLVSKALQGQRPKPPP